MFSACLFGHRAHDVSTPDAISLRAGATVQHASTEIMRLCAQGQALVVW
jgi:hypothetical protein